MFFPGPLGFTIKFCLKYGTGLHSFLCALCCPNISSVWTSTNTHSSVRWLNSLHHDVKHQQGKNSDCSFLFILFIVRQRSLYSAAALGEVLVALVGLVGLSDCWGLETAVAQQSASCPFTHMMHSPPDVCKDPKASLMHRTASHTWKITADN